MMKPVEQHPDLVNQVYLSLRDAICEGRLMPGERLHQDQLAAKLNVSRQPVGQAIQILKSQGFVRDTGRRGVEIASLSVEQLTGLYQVRAALDALAAREAALNNPVAAREEGPSFIEKGRRHCQTGSVMEMIHADMAFHRFVYRISGNPAIDHTVSPHWYHLLRIMGLVLQHKPPRQKIWDEHTAILEAIKQGDAKNAEYLARQHGENAAAELAKQIRSEASLVSAR
jgi:DNA-binding GntR family transcriptional regulator